MSISTKREGRRTYILGTAFEHRSQCKAAGATWDGEKRAWWLGNDAKAKALAAQLAAQPVRGAFSGLKDTDTLHGRGRHQGKSCLIVWMGNTARGRSAKLANLGGTMMWWAPADEVEVQKVYGGGWTEDDRGREHRRQPMTWGKLKQLREEFRAGGGTVVGVREARAARSGCCQACGGELKDAGHHKAMGGLCGSCAFDEYDM